MLLFSPSSFLGVSVALSDLQDDRTVYRRLYMTMIYIQLACMVFNDNLGFSFHWNFRCIPINCL